MRRFFAMATWAALSCTSSVLAAADEAERAGCPTTWSPGAQACVWELVELAQPFVVRSVRGTLRNEGGGDWPDGVDVTIELAQVGRTEQRRVAHARVPSGRFEVRAVKPGEYCFRIGVRPIGWSCTEGRIVVKRAAPAKARVNLTIELGK
jgi:hypothetical protein